MPTTLSILVTGDKGFIGSKLKRRLIDLGHVVAGYDRLDGNDLMDLKTLESQILRADAIFHIAAQADLTRMANSIEAGRDGVIDNVGGTHNLAFLCARHSKWLIYASTVCIYGNSGSTTATDEDALPNPPELYACSKYAAELIVRGYGLNHGMPWTSLRFATSYGPGMRPSMGMHIFFTQALSGTPITVHGDGRQTRNFTYIDDLVDGMIACLKHPTEARNEIVNLTAAESVSALKMAEDIKQVTKSTSPIVFVLQRENQTLREHISAEKAQRLFGWQSRTSWGDGLVKTLDWMRSL
jgi:nucleoside-diphosphate-sugar epimerase